MNAGALSQRVSIVRLDEVTDGHDGYTEADAVVHRRVPARVRPLVGRDLERAVQIDPRITHEVALRYWKTYRTDLAGGRVKLVYHDVDDRDFEIIGAPVDVDEAHDELRLTVKEAA